MFFASYTKFVLNFWTNNKAILAKDYEKEGEKILIRKTI